VDGERWTRLRKVYIVKQNKNKKEKRRKEKFQEGNGDYTLCTFALCKKNNQAHVIN
jgi:hypothetical protein